MRQECEKQPEFASRPENIVLRGESGKGFQKLYMVARRCLAAHHLEKASDPLSQDSTKQRKDPRKFETPSLRVTRHILGDEFADGPDTEHAVFIGKGNQTPELLFAEPPTFKLRRVLQQNPTVAGVRASRAREIEAEHAVGRRIIEAAGVIWKATVVSRRKEDKHATAETSATQSSKAATSSIFAIGWSTLP